MNLMDIAAGFSAKLFNRIAVMNRLSRFTCGDCEFSDRCDLPPTAACFFREEQIAHGRWKSRRRAFALSRDRQWGDPPELKHWQM